MDTQTLILGTAGHIDHGKTALVHALTGVDTDRLPQEKARGITIDIGFAELDLGHTRLGVVDVPGHERFIRNMLAGASGIDIALLVVAADDSVMPQTREHLAILQLLEIPRGVIAITKSDLADSTWLELVEEEIRHLVQGTFLEGAPIVATSAPERTGLDDLRAVLESVCRQIKEPEHSNMFRMAVDRSFVGQGVGTIVTGTVSSGELTAGDKVQWLPGGDEVRVRGVQTHGRPAESVGRGQRAAINLMGVHHTQIVRGHELASPGFLEPTRLLTGSIEVLPDAPRPLVDRARVRFHVGTQEVMASVRLLGQRRIEPGETGVGQMILAEPTMATGRQPFVLRAQSPVTTLGGGRVLLPVMNRLIRRTGGAIDALHQLAGEVPAERVEAALRLRGLRHLEPATISRDTAVPVSDVPAIIEELIEQGRAIRLGTGSNLILHSDVFGDARTRIERTITALHESNPLEPTLQRSRILQRFAWMGAATVLDAVITQLVAEGELKGDHQSVALKSFRPRLSNAQQRLYQTVRATYEQACFMPPDVSEIARDQAMPESEVRSILDLCVQSGHLVHIGGTLYMDIEAEARMRSTISKAMGQTSGLAMGEIRDALNTTRKYAVPLCEYLDQVGFTRRVGDVRVLA